jgi:hypothetical protein
MAKEVKEQEQDKDTTKTIPPVGFHSDSHLRHCFLTSKQPPEPTVGFGSAVKAIFQSLKARLCDLQAIAQNQASRAFQSFFG